MDPRSRVCSVLERKIIINAVARRRQESAQFALRPRNSNTDGVFANPNGLGNLAIRQLLPVHQLKKFAVTLLKPIESSAYARHVDGVNVVILVAPLPRNPREEARAAVTGPPLIREDSKRNPVEPRKLAISLRFIIPPSPRHQKRFDDHVLAALKVTPSPQRVPHDGRRVLTKETGVVLTPRVDVHEVLRRSPLPDVSRSLVDIHGLNSIVPSGPDPRDVRARRRGTRVDVARTVRAISHDYGTRADVIRGHLVSEGVGGEIDPQKRRSYDELVATIINVLI